MLSLPLLPSLYLRIYKKIGAPPKAPLLYQRPILKMALISRVEINVANNAKLRVPRGLKIYL